MAQKKTAGAKQPAAKKTETELTLVLPSAAERASELASATPAPAAPAVAPAKAKTVKRPVAAPAKAPKADAGAALSAVGYDDLAAAGQAAIDTYLACSKIAAEGVEILGKEVVGFARESAEAQFAFAQTLMAAKTLQDAIEAQSDYTAKNIDYLAVQTAKLTDMSVKLANQIMEPIQARVDATAQTWLRPLAA